MLWCISECYLFLFPCQKHEGIFLMEVKLKAFVEALCDWMPLEFLIPRAVHTKILAIYRLQFRFSYSRNFSHDEFLSWFSAQVNHISLYLPACLSSLGTSSFSCALIFLTELSKVVAFSVYLVFAVVRI